MKSTKFLSLLIFMPLFQAYSVQAQTFSIHENGVTVVCDDANVGDTGEVNGIVYTKRTKEQITPENASSTCTSGIINMSNLFKDVTVEISDLSTWDVSSVFTMYSMFYQSEYDEDSSPWDVNLSSWDVSTVTNMTLMFYQSSFNGDISSWDVSNVESMWSMFYFSLFNGDISAWNVSKVTDMGFMFVGTTFNGDLSSWNVSNVTNMVSMFRKTPFNGDISTWDVSNVQIMDRLFMESSFNGDISSWDVSNVTCMNSMFQRAPFNGDISSWDVSNVTNMNSMFRETIFNGDISFWDVSNVTDMTRMFSQSSFNGDISSWNVSNVTKFGFGFMFESGITQSTYDSLLIGWSKLDLQNNIEIGFGEVQYSGIAKIARDSIIAQNNWTINDGGLLNNGFLLSNNGLTIYCNGASVESSWTFNEITYTKRTVDQITPENASTSCTSDISLMNSLFKNADLNNVDISSWDVSSVTEMNALFEGSSNLDTDLSFWDVSNVKDMSLMFSGASFNGDISTWDVSNVNSMSGMFLNSEFTGDLSQWNVINVTSMDNMFSGSEFDGDISTWDVSNVTSMSGTFLNSEFTGDLSQWNVFNVTSMDSMFSGSEFNGVINDWDVSNVSSMNSLFSGALNFNQNLNNWNVSSATSNNAMANIFDNSGMSGQNFDNTFIGWYKEMPSYPENINFGALGLTYCSSVDLISLLQSEYNWNISASAESICVTGVEIIEPEIGTVSDLPITLVWRTKELESSEIVRLQISTDSDFETILFERSYSNSDTTQILTDNDLDTSDKYYWRLRTESPDKIGSWATSNFRVKTDFVRLISDSTFIASPNYVNVMLHALDRNNNGVDYLEKDSFELLENGSPISNTESNYQISKLEGIPFELKTVLMLDNSLSIGEENLELIKQAVSIFIENKIPEMEISIYVFADGYQKLIDFTADTNLLLNTVQNISLTNIPGTDIYSAAIEGLNAWEDEYYLTNIVQGFMVLFTDGRDLAGRRTLNEVIAERGNKQVFTVGVELDPNDFDRNAIEQIGNAGTFIDGDFSNLAVRFETVKEELIQFSNSFYWLNYASSGRSSNRELTVRIVNNSNNAPDSEINTIFDASSFYAAPIDIVVNGSAENPLGVTEINMPADSSIEVRIETVFSYNLEPFKFNFTDESKLSIESVPDKPFVFRFIANGELDDIIGVGIQDTSQVSLTLNKTLVVNYDRITTSNELNEDFIPEAFSLSQNYPNPFNPSTQISYTLNNAENVVLEVFDMVGQRVKKLVNQKQNAGTYTVSFDASALASGIYIYRIQAGSFVQTKKMLLIK